MTTANLDHVTTGVAAPVDRPQRAAVQVLTVALPFAVVLLGYAFAGSLEGGYLGRYSQGAANDLGFVLRVVEPVRVDRWLFGQLPTVWLQDRLYAPGQAHWYDAVVAPVYLSHYVVSPAIAAALWLRNRTLFRAWAGCVLVMAVLGLATYIVYPMAPPWLAADTGIIEPVSRTSGLGWEYLHLDAVAVLVENGQAVSNPVAAMPSLHVGFAALCAAFFVSRAAVRRNFLLACYPLAMGFAVVYTGEHYVVDVLVGAVYASIVVVSWRLLRRPSTRQLSPEPSPDLRVRQ